MWKKILVGLGVGFGVLVVSPSFKDATIDGATLVDINKELVAPNDSQTVEVRYLVPSTPPGDSIKDLWFQGYEDGVLRFVSVSAKRVPGDTVKVTWRVGPPVPGKTKSYVFQIRSILLSGKPVRARSFYWERTNTSTHPAPLDSVSLGANIRWSNPITAGVLGDSFRVWRREYILPDTLGSSLLYDGTIFPGDTQMSFKNKVIVGRMYKYYGSVYLFGAERVRYPFITMVVR